MLVEVQGIDRLFRAGSFCVVENPESVCVVGKATNGLRYPVMQLGKPSKPDVVTWDQMIERNKTAKMLAEKFPNDSLVLNICQPISETEVEISENNLMHWEIEIESLTMRAQRYAKKLNQK